MSKINSDKKRLSSEQREELLRALKARSEKNMNRHKGLEWAKVQAKLEANTEKLWSLNEMERTGVYFHPTGPDCCRNLIPYVPYMAVEIPHDTTRAVTSLLYSGAFTRLRDIRFIFSHAGETIPMLAGRIAGSASIRREIAERLPDGVEYELKRLYYDVANSANRPAIAALTSLVQTSHIVFGSDYPYSQIDETANGMSTLGLSATDLQAIRYNNAVALFPRLKAARR